MRRKEENFRLTAREFTESLAMFICDGLDDVGIHFRHDYDDDKMDKLELGRKIARKFYRSVRNWEKEGK